MKKIIAPIFILLLIVFGYGIYFFSSSSKVSVHKIKKEDIISTVRLSCLADPQEKYFLSFVLNGQINKLHISSIGETVKKDQLIAELDSISARESLLFSKQKLNQKKFELEKLEEELKQANELFKKGAKQKTEIQKLNKELLKAEKELAIEEDYFKIQNEKMSHLKVTSPVDGFILDINRDLSRGKFVRSGDFLSVIGTQESILLEGFIDVEDVDLFSEEKSVLVFERNILKPSRGKIVKVAEAASKGKVRILVQADKVFFPGSFVDVEIPKIVKKQVLKAPHQSIGKNKKLWIIRKNKAVPIHVKLGKADAWGIEVSSSEIREGTLVIVNPEGLGPGEKVSY